MGVVKRHDNIVGSTYNFPRMASITANTKSRNADITAIDPTIDAVTATLADFYAGIYYDQLDELKTNANIRQEMVAASVNAIARKADDIIIAAATAATNTTATTGGVLTLSKILECLTYLNSSDVDETDRVLVVGAKQMSDALAIQQLTSTDYVQIQSILQSGMGTALGFTWIMSNRLPLDAGNRTCFAFNKSALGLAVGKDITTEINYIPQKVSNLINSFISLGSVVIDNTGITKMTCAE